MKQKYYKYKITNLLRIKSVVTLHNFSFDKNFKSFDESHDFYEFVYCRKGSLIINQDNNNIDLKEGEIIFHSPNVIHGLSSNGEVSPSLYIVSFVCQSKQISYFDNKKLEVPARLKPILNMIFEVGSETFDIDNTTPNTKKMSVKEDAAPGGLQSLTNLLEFFLIELMRTQSVEEIKYLINTNELIDKIIVYLKNNIESKVTIEDVTKEFGYSKSLLFKEFKLATGSSIIAYYINLKIDRAKVLLKTTNMSISDISNTLAFNDVNYFIKTFKRVANTTPLKYRTKYKK